MYKLEARLNDVKAKIRPEESRAAYGASSKHVCMCPGGVVKNMCACALGESSKTCVHVPWGSR